MRINIYNIYNLSRYTTFRIVSIEVQAHIPGFYNYALKTPICGVRNKATQPNGEVNRNAVNNKNNNNIAIFIAIFLNQNSTNDFKFKINQRNSDTCAHINTTAFI